MANKPQKKKMNKHLNKPKKAINFVLRHSINKSGAGAHVDKKGEKAPRCRQKRNWKKDCVDD